MNDQSPLLDNSVAEGTSDAREYGTHSRRTSRTTAEPRTSIWRLSLPQSLRPLMNAFQNFMIFVYNQWFSFTLIVQIVIASQVQVPKAWQEIKKNIVLYVCVTIIFFITGCTLPSDVLMANYSRWRLHLFCQIQIFLLASVMVFGVVSAAASTHRFMDPGLLVGLVFMGCVPTTISSNVVLTKQAGGNAALTVVQSTLGNFIGPFICPFLISMYLSTNAWYTQIVPPHAMGNYTELYRRVLSQLALTIYIPLLVGQAFRKIFPRATSKVFVEYKVSKLSTFALLVVMWQPFDAAFVTGAFDDIHWNNLVFLVFISIALYVVWTIVCIALALPWLNKMDVVAIAYTIPAKTTSIGVPLAEAVFIGVDPTLSAKFKIPVVVYQGLQVALGGLIANSFRSWVEQESMPRRPHDVVEPDN